MLARLPGKVEHVLIVVSEEHRRRARRRRRQPDGTEPRAQLEHPLALDEGRAMHEQSREGEARGPHDVARAGQVAVLLDDGRDRHTLEGGAADLALQRRKHHDHGLAPPEVDVDAPGGGLRRGGLGREPLTAVGAWRV
eukprot:scaffold4078_cov68-Phaeocystis_antarctica.AAC.26